jgi:hypothetical protein
VIPRRPAGRRCSAAAGRAAWFRGDRRGGVGEPWVDDQRGEGDGARSFSWSQRRNLESRDLDRSGIDRDPVVLFSETVASLHVCGGQAELQRNFPSDRKRAHG